MPYIYYSNYIPLSDSVREVNEQEHRLGRELLAMALYELYDLRLRPEDISATEKGKPFLPAYPTVHFNISHCDGLVACAVDDSPVGVDAEKTGYYAEILIKKVFSEEEKSFFTAQTVQKPEASAAAADSIKELRQEWFCRFWTLKEAYVKRSGIGVDTDLKAFSFRFTDFTEEDQPEKVVSADPDSSASAVCKNRSLSVVCSDPAVRCFQTALSGGHIISLCYTGDHKSVCMKQIFL